MTKSKVVISKSLEETFELGNKFAKSLKKGDVVALIGELGAGKTSFVKGMASGLGVKKTNLVRSPSFTLLNEHLTGKIALYHFDLYRLFSEAELFEIGIEDYLERDGISVIEWADHFPDFWPERTIYVRFEIISETQRRICY
ncbi:MAG: tRNA (adenosine(37)-N6)-threonylcarbamoyltransferase complex ATPase subunit type 1 TsaE [Pseudomonadota bacterium]